MIKYLYTAIATTGYNSENDDIIKMAFLLEEAGNSEIVDKVIFHLKPRKGRLPESISKEALKFNDITIEELRKLPEPDLICGDLLSFFRKHKKDVIIPVCHNSEFDLNFLGNFISRYTDYGIGDFLFHKDIDLMSVAPFVEFSCNFKFDNYKFNTLCDYYRFTHKPESVISKVSNIRKIHYAFKNNILKEITNEKK